VRRFLPELVDLIWNRRIDPGKVYDLELPRRISLAFGALYLITIITSVPALWLFQPVLDDPQGYIAGGGADNRIYLGALLELILIIANIGTAIVLIPLLKRQHEILTFSYVAARIMECVFILAGILAVLAVVTLRHDAGADAAALGGLAESLAAIKDWTFKLGPGWVVGIGNGFILGYLMYRSGLMPRGLALLGLIGGPLQTLAATGVLFDLYDAGGAVQGIATIPEIVWELSLGIYPLVWGFKSSPILAEEGRPVLQPSLGPVIPRFTHGSAPAGAGGLDCLDRKDPHRERRGPPFHRELTPFEIAEVGARSGVGRLADQHLTRARERRQPRRDVDRVAERGEVGDGRVGADGAYVRDAGVDAGTDRNEVGRRAQQVGCGLDRLSCVVRTDGGHVERDYLVADELVDEPVAVDYDTVRAVEEAVHQPAELRRPHLLRERRRPAHVGEQHRDLDLGAARMRPHERLADVAVVRVLRGWTALEDEAYHGSRRSAERHEARLAARRAGDAPMSPALASHGARVAGDDGAPELLVVGHATIVERRAPPRSSATPP
jgi:hypothetical protein